MAPAGVGPGEPDASPLAGRSRAAKAGALWSTRVGLAATCVLALVLGSVGLTDEGYAPAGGDMARYVMNGVFLRDLVADAPFAGWRQPRRTKAERLERPGRALHDWELAPLWRAAGGEGWPFGAYLRILLMLGQRRAETALMRWRDLILAPDTIEISPDLLPQSNVWLIPEAVTKSGRVHKVPLPPQAGQGFWPNAMSMDAPGSSSPATDSAARSTGRACASALVAIGPC